MADPLPEVVLDSDRLTLRPYRLQDAPDVQLACSDPRTQRWIPLPDPYTADVATSWVTDESHRLRRTGTGSIFAVESRETGRLVAGFGLHRVDDRDRTAEIGYWVAPWARGQGIGAEATRRLARYAFDDLGLGRVDVLVEPANAASHRVAAKAGCTYEGVRVAAGVGGPARERRVDLAAWRLLPGDPFPTPRRFPDVTALSDGVLTLRPVQEADREGVTVEMSDPEHERWVGSSATPVAERVRIRMEHGVLRWLSGQAACLTVVSPEGGYAGSVDVYGTHLDWGVGMLGWALHPAARGRGLMRRSLRLAADWAFDQAGLARLEAGVAVENVRSQRTAEAAGFHREGVARGLQPTSDGRRDMITYALLPGDLS